MLFSPVPVPPRPDRCPLCGQPNDCQLCSNAPYKGPCWCFGAEIPAGLLAQVPADLRRQCLCRSCVTAFRRVQATD